MEVQEKIEKFFEKHGVEPRKINSRSYIFNCPACGGDEKLYIEKATGRSICFKHKTPECPTSKTGIVKTLHLLSEVPIGIVAQEMSNKIITNMEEVLSFEDEVKQYEKEQEEKELPPITIKELPFDVKPINWPESKEGLDYLYGRGLHLDLMLKLHIMYSPKWRRVIFPVIMNGVLYGWQGRSIDKNNKLRMYNFPGEWKSKTLMFFDNIKNKDFAILAEGAISALKFYHCESFVATMGKVVSESQLKLLLDGGIKKIYLALDPDAVLEMEEIVKKLLMRGSEIECFLVKVPLDKEDFGECTYEECLNAYKNAEKLDLDCSWSYAYAMERL